MRDTRRYRGGVRTSQGLLLDGQREGEWRLWHSDGALRAEDTVVELLQSLSRGSQAASGGATPLDGVGF